MDSEFDRYITDAPKVSQWRSPLTWSILIAYITDAPKASKWRSPFTWSILIVLSWLIYEVTAQPVLGAVVACIKFGWEDYLTGRWLRRVDPNRCRGQVLYHAYLAYGFLKIVVA